MPSGDYNKKIIQADLGIALLGVWGQKGRLSGFSLVLTLGRRKVAGDASPDVSRRNRLTSWLLVICFSFLVSMLPFP